MRIGFVTGLLSEQQTLFDAGGHLVPPVRPLTACAGASQERAEKCAARLVSEGAELLISFGIAGGLDPAYKTGDIIVASSVKLAQGSELVFDERQRDRLISLLLNAGFSVWAGMILGVDQVIADPQEKSILHHRTSAAAVDMESAGVAQAAFRHNVDFLALRVIADTADEVIPSSALGAISDTGEAKPWPVIKGLMRHPTEIPKIRKLAKSSRIAHATLAKAADISVRFSG